MLAFGEDETNQQHRTDDKPDDCWRALPADPVGVDESPHDTEEAAAEENDPRIVQAAGFRVA